MELETILGLEVHVQLKTKTKLFCACPNQYTDEPNTHVCPICLGFPGVLPVLNRQVPELAIKLGLAMHCEIQQHNRFARKNYFYPDLPKGYQISQFEEPICGPGFMDIEIGENQTRRIGITRIHIEEDAGKLLHDEAGEPISRVDFNRSSVPLLEVVSQPDLRSAQEARVYLQKLREYLRYLDVSDADMEKGQFRCDINISLRPVGTQKLGTRVEVKNVNSFRFVMQAIEYEETRQERMLRSGKPIVQETRLYDPNKGITVSMRSKEEAHDYRYFPDPDLVPLHIEPVWIKEIQAGMCELPDARQQRLMTTLSLSAQDAAQLVREKSIADYFEEALSHGAASKPLANWVLGDLMRESKKEDGFTPAVDARRLAELVSLIEKGAISGKIAKEIFPAMVETGTTAAEIVESRGLSLVADPGAITKLIAEVLAAHPDSVGQFKAGKTKIVGFLVGQVMKKSRGQAEPAIVNELLLAALEKS